MKIPKGYTESDVLALIERCVSLLAHSFSLGYWSTEDIAQTARLEALKLLESGKFNPKEGQLGNILYAHIKNRLLNLRRNLISRWDTPCEKCHSGIPCTGTRHYCKKFEEWLHRNQTKANLMKPASLTEVIEDVEPSIHSESTVVEDASLKEILLKIDKELSPDLRSTYLQMRAGVTVNKARRAQVEEAVKIIIGDA